MFEIGMRAHDLGRQPFDSLVETAKKNGIGHIQLAFTKAISDMDFSQGNYSPGLAHYIANTLRENDIHVSVLGCYIDPFDQQEIKRFQEHLLYARAMGADMVGTETGYSDKPEEEAYQEFLQNMKTIIATAEKLGVMVGVEAVCVHTLKSPQVMKRFLDDVNSPNVCVIFDPCNLINEENYEKQHEMIDEVFELYGERVAVMHIKDFSMQDGVKKSVPIGEGIFDFEYLLAKLKERKPHIMMLLEESSEQRVHQDVAYLKDCLGRV